MPSTTYRGHDGSIVAHAVGQYEPLPLRLDLKSHSPTGFAWGYLGSGPAQAALALLAHATGCDRLALRYYQLFKLEVLAQHDVDQDLVLHARDIHEWLRPHMAADGLDSAHLM